MLQRSAIGAAARAAAEAPRAPSSAVHPRASPPPSEAATVRSLRRGHRLHALSRARYRPLLWGRISRSARAAPFSPRARHRFWIENAPHIPATHPRSCGLEQLERSSTSHPVYLPHLMLHSCNRRETRISSNRPQASDVTWFLVYIRTYLGSRISKRSPVVAGSPNDQVKRPPAALMPCPGQQSASSDGATT
ncbi:hypothetical protein MRX96_022902 [Rhipicephalus microplus]